METRKPSCSRLRTLSFTSSPTRAAACRRFCRVRRQPNSGDVAGMPVHQLPAQFVMSADDLVDAALAGLDLGETVTIPSLADKAEWDRYETARLAMSSKLSSAIPAPRYNLHKHAAA